MCGLKDFCQHSKKSPDNEMMAEEKIPKMASVVGILGHLASKHSQDIRMALMKLFEVSERERERERASIYMQIIPNSLTNVK